MSGTLNGWQTRRITPAVTVDGRPSHVIVGTYLTGDDRLMMGLQVGHDEESVLLLGPAVAGEHITSAEQSRAELS